MAVGDEAATTCKYRWVPYVREPGSRQGQLPIAIIIGQRDIIPDEPGRTAPARTLPDLYLLGNLFEAAGDFIERGGHGRLQLADARFVGDGHDLALPARQLFIFAF
jgi:hypothetical protein